MGIIVPRKGKKRTTYKAVIRISGKPTVAKTFRSWQDAKEFIAATESKLYKDQAVEPRGSYTVHDVIERYGKVVQLPTRKAPETIRTQQHYLRYWDRSFGSVLLDGLTSSMISAHVDLLRGKFHPATVKNYLVMLSTLLNWSIRWNWLQINPMRNVTKPKIIAKHDRFLDQEEIDRLLTVARRDHSIHAYPFVMMLLSTGMRVGDIQRLKWSNVSLIRGEVKFRQQKTNIIHAIPLNKKCIQALFEYQEALGMDTLEESMSGKDDYVFSNGKGGMLYTKKMWNRIRSKALLDDVRRHDIRHTVASQLSQDNVPIQEIAAILGHKSIASTMRYAHINQQKMKGTMDRLSERMFRRQPTNPKYGVEEEVE
jgi:integrase